MKNETIQINKIIDDAMKKKDREVNIFIGAFGTTIKVIPFEAEKDPHWIVELRNDGHMSGFPYRCSECGCQHNRITPYCPECGEKLKIPYPETEVKNGEST